MTSLAHICPTEQDAREFASALGTEERAACLAWGERVARIDAAQGRRVALMEEVAREMGVSYATVRGKYYGWLNAGKSWRALADRRKMTAADGRGGLPSRFLEFWAGLLEAHQRDTSGAQAYKVLLSRWRNWRGGDAGSAVPGYPEPPPASSRLSLHPAGWSYENLMRLAKKRSSPYARTLRRQGPKAAAMQHLPNVLRTRAMLKPLQIVYFDDQEYDTAIILPGSRLVDAEGGVRAQVARPVGFNWLDHLTGFQGYTLKMSRREVGEDNQERRKMLVNQDFVWMHIAFLMVQGWRKGGSINVFEHGSASGYKATASHGSYDQALAAATGGAVEVRRSGKFGDPAFRELLFRGQVAGNPRFKAPIESIFNLVRNKFSALPGATGRHFELKPEESAGRDRYAERMAQIAAALPDELAELVQFEHMLPGEFYRVAAEIYAAINGRRDHRLEGWEQAGFVEPGYLMPGAEGAEQWVGRDALARLSPAEREVAARFAELRPRRLSPAEAFERRMAADREAGEIKRLSPAMVPALLPGDWAREVKVARDHTISFTDRDAAPSGDGRLHYFATLRTLNGRTEVLNAGEAFRAFVNPYAPQILILTDQQGRFLGTCDEQPRHDAGDPTAARHSLGKVREIKKLLDLPARSRAAEKGAQRAGMFANNRAICEIAGVDHPGDAPKKGGGAGAPRRAAREQPAQKNAIDLIVLGGGEEHQPDEDHDS